MFIIGQKAEVIDADIFRNTAIALAMHIEKLRPVKDKTAAQKPEEITGYPTHEKMKDAFGKSTTNIEAFCYGRFIENFAKFLEPYMRTNTIENLNQALTDLMTRAMSHYPAAVEKIMDTCSKRYEHKKAEIFLEREGAEAKAKKILQDLADVFYVVSIEETRTHPRFRTVLHEDAATVNRLFVGFIERVKALVASDEEKKLVKLQVPERKAAM